MVSVPCITDTDTTGIGIDTDTGIGIGPPLVKSTETRWIGVVHNIQIL